MEIFKKGTISILLLIVMLGVSGCMEKKDNNSPKGEMMTYMQEKYGEEFEFVNIGTEVWSANYNEMIVHSSSFPGKRIVVHRDKESGTIADNYVALLINNDIEKAFSEIVSQVYGENLIINIPKQNVLPAEFNRKTTVDEYAKDIISGVDINIFLEGSAASKEQDVERLRELFAEKQYPISFTIYYVKSGTLDMINSSNYSKYTKPNSESVVVRGEFVMNKAFEFTLNKWGEMNE